MSPFVNKAINSYTMAGIAWIVKQFTNTGGRERTEHIMREGLTNKKTIISGIVASKVVEDLGSSFTYSVVQKKFPSV